MEIHIHPLLVVLAAAVVAPLVGRVMVSLFNCCLTLRFGWLMADPAAPQVVPKKDWYAAPAGAPEVQKRE